MNENQSHNFIIIKVKWESCDGTSRQLFTNSPNYDAFSHVFEVLWIATHFIYSNFDWNPSIRIKHYVNEQTHSPLIVDQKVKHTLEADAAKESKRNREENGRERKREREPQRLNDRIQSWKCNHSNRKGRATTTRIK